MKPARMWLCWLGVHSWYAPAVYWPGSHMITSCVRCGKIGARRCS